MVRTVHFDALRGGFRNLMGEKLGEGQCGNFSRGSDPLSSRRTRGSLALPSGCLCCLASVGIAPHAAHRTIRTRAELVTKFKTRVCEADAERLADEAIEAQRAGTSDLRYTMATSVCKVNVIVVHVKD